MTPTGGRTIPGPQGRAYYVPTSPPHLPHERALRVVTLPLSVAWSGQRRTLDLAIPADRVLAYRAVMAEGGPEDIASIVDADLLAEVFDDLLLPRAIEPAWRALLGRGE